jgi:hypothetical protein
MPREPALAIEPMKELARCPSTIASRTNPFTLKRQKTAISRAVQAPYGPCSVSLIHGSEYVPWVRHVIRLPSEKPPYAVGGNRDAAQRQDDVRDDLIQPQDEQIVADVNVSA